ncbi:DUF7010 family protein [Streptomonospora algeriensis]|uniref:DUF7010 family protein n=1 Tax=Streptomonospora algeriensis TaxID=995084 RepID=A0ABW3BEM6_9ACTN
MILTAECRELDRNLRRRGAFVLAFFALMWALAGASGLGRAVPAVAAGAVAVSAAVVVLAYRYGYAGDRQRERRLPHGWGRSVGVVNIAQAAAIAAAVLLLVNTGSTLLLPPVVCLIVGLHFFPLARLYDQRQYHWTGVLLTAVAAAGFGGATWGAGTQAVLSAVGFAAALVLWASAVHVAVRN